MAEALDWTWAFVAALWVAVFAASAGVAVWKFRTTPAGIVLGASYALLALKIIVMKVIHRGMRDADLPGYEIQGIVSALSQCTSLCLGISVVVGLALIPISLRRAGAAPENRESPRA